MSEHLTAETIRAAIDGLRTATYTVCVGSDTHVIGPHEVELDLASCANCGAMVSPNGTWGLAPPDDTEESTVDPKKPNICPSCSRPINQNGECGCT